MTELAPESEKDSFLRRPISSWLRLDGWMVIAALILVAAAVTRLWDLGSRSYNHDEAIHAWESWKLFTGQGYIHNPVYHGPFLYHITAFIYFLFGHSDYTGRLSAAIFGILTIGAIFYLRPWLKARGTLVAAALAVISPALMYYGRFIRHDAFSVVFTLLVFIGILNYLESRQNKYLYLVVLGQVLYFSNMETAFIQTFTFWTFLAGLLLVQWRRSPGRSLRDFPAFDLLLVMGTLLLPLASPLGIKAAGIVLKDAAFDPVAYTPDSLLRSGVIWAIFVVASVAVGLWWDRKRWLVSAGIFYAIYIVLFTAFFTNGQGFATGQVGSLGYWLSQQGVRRGAQPWHYYLILVPLYEYLPLLFGLIGGGYYLLRQRLLQRAAGRGAAVAAAGPGGLVQAAMPAGTAERPGQAAAMAVPERGDAQQSEAAAASAPAGLSRQESFVPMVLYWAVVNLVVFSWGGEKMPWLLVHLTLPWIIVTGWFAEHLLAADWRALYRRGAGWVALLLPLTVVAAVGALSVRPFTGTSIDSLNATMTWLAAFALLLIVGLPLVHFGGELGWRQTGRVALVVLFLGLAAFTVHNSWMAVFQNGDVATETLTYAQGSPDDALIMRELDFMSRRLAGGEKDLKVAYDDESSWPFVWYFRDWPNAEYYGKAPSGPMDAAVVLVGAENEAAVKPFLGNKYYRRQYRLIWWPIEDYKSLTPAKIWQNLTNPATRQSLWNIIMYRKYDVPLSGWPLVHNIAMYVRKDIAQQIWDYGPETAGAQAAPEEDPYLIRYQSLTAARSLGGGGAAAGLGEPKGIALDAQAARLYVADSASHRIQVLDAASGAPVATWGSHGNGPGQFEQPWGVAVGPDGSVYVADTWNHRIQKLDRDGMFVAQWGTFGQAGAQDAGVAFYGPRGIAVDGQGNVWVTDTGNKRVLKFDPNGRLLGQWGGSGAGEGQFLEPVGIAIDSKGQIFVADTWNRRVQVFDAQFSFLRQWGVEAWEGQSVANKPYLAVDGGGNVYVTDVETHRVIKFGSDGQVLAVWGKRGADLSSFNLPTGIAVDVQGNILVSDTANSRVLEFAPVQ